LLFETFLDKKILAILATDLYRALTRLVIRPDHPNEVLALQFGHRALRHQDAVGASTKIHTDAPEHSRPEYFRGIGKLSTNPQGAGLDVHGPINEHKLALVGMQSAIGQHKCYGQFLDLFAGSSDFSLRSEIIHLADIAIKP